jgi:hypothetical protein
LRLLHLLFTLSDFHPSLCQGTDTQQSAISYREQRTNDQMDEFARKGGEALKDCPMALELGRILVMPETKKTHTQC